jgi:hypothetical protein
MVNSGCTSGYYNPNGKCPNLPPAKIRERSLMYVSCTGAFFWSEASYYELYACGTVPADIASRAHNAGSGDNNLTP